MEALSQLGSTHMYKDCSHSRLSLLDAIRSGDNSCAEVFVEDLLGAVFQQTSTSVCVCVCVCVCVRACVRVCTHQSPCPSALLRPGRGGLYSVLLRALLPALREKNHALTGGHTTFNRGDSMYFFCTAPAPVGS